MKVSQLVIGNPASNSVCDGKNEYPKNCQLVELVSTKC